MQRNLVFSLYRQLKCKYFSSVSRSDDTKNLWKQCKPHYFNKPTVGFSKIMVIMVIENNKMILEKQSVSE